MKRDKGISLMIWKLEDSELASKLWGGYEATSGGYFRELWERRGCFRRNYIFFRGDTREFAGCVSLEVVNDIRKIYEVVFSIRREFCGDSGDIYKKLTAYLLEQGDISMLIKPGAGSCDLEGEGFTPLSEGEYAGFFLKEPSYVIKKRIYM